MARIRLRTLAESTIPYRWPADRSGTLLSIPIYRLRVQMVALPPDADPDESPPGDFDFLRRIDAIVDTGAPLTTLGYGRWRSFEEDIR